MKNIIEHTRNVTTNITYIKSKEQKVKWFDVISINN